ncbi:MAG: hypothetical protein ACQERN_13455 [Thermodesulfobacteriota bacterium]
MGGIDDKARDGKTVGDLGQHCFISGRCGVIALLQLFFQLPDPLF